MSWCDNSDFHADHDGILLSRPEQLPGDAMVPDIPHSNVDVMDGQDNVGGDVNELYLGTTNIADGSEGEQRGASYSESNSSDDEIDSPLHNESNQDIGPAAGEGSSPNNLPKPWGAAKPTSQPWCKRPRNVNKNKKPARKLPPRCYKCGRFIKKQSWFACLTRTVSKTLSMCPRRTNICPVCDRPFRRMKGMRKGCGRGSRGRSKSRSRSRGRRARSASCGRKSKSRSRSRSKHRRARSACGRGSKRHRSSSKSRSRSRSRTRRSRRSRSKRSSKSGSACCPPPGGACGQPAVKRRRRPRSGGSGGSGGCCPSPAPSFRQC